MSRRAALPVLFFLLAVSASPARAESYTALTTDPAADRHPSWSPDGQTIAFESNRSGSWQIYRMDADGSNVVALTSVAGGAQHPEISPDGLTVAFSLGDYNASNSVASYAYIASVPLSGGSVTPVTSYVSTHIDALPTWSPDGSLIYFSRREPGPSYFNYSLYTVPPSGGPGTLYLDVGEVEHAPTISPDGQWIAFSKRNVGEALNMYEAPVATPYAFSQLTFESKNTGPDDYSPDGSKILYGSRKFGGKSEMLEYNRITQTSTRLTYDTDSFSGDPVYGVGDYDPSDGARFLYTSARVTGDYNIWLVDRNAPPEPVGTLAVDDASGLPGGAMVPVTVSLTSSRAVSGLQFRVSDMPELLTVTGVAATGRADGATVSFVEDGGVRILAFTATNDPIPAGTGPILTLTVEIAPGANLGDMSTLSLSDLTGGAPDGNLLDLNTEDGTFTVARLPGDINGDNSVDPGDLVRLIEILLGTGNPPSADELAAADCNADSTVDVRDATCVIDIVGPIPSEAPGGPGATAPVVLDARVPVRSLAIRFPAGSAAPVEKAEAAPLRMRSGVDEQGRTFVLLWDPAGGELAIGRHTVLAAEGVPSALRAWGAGGRPLAVTFSGGAWVVEEAATPEIGPPVIGSAPNPFLDRTVISFRTETKGRVTIDLFDTRGALVRRLIDVELPAGSHEVPWDGRDGAGRPVVSGVYHGRVATVDGRNALQLVRLRR